MCSLKNTGVSNRIKKKSLPFPQELVIESRASHWKGTFPTTEQQPGSSPNIILKKLYTIFFFLFYIPPTYFLILWNMALCCAFCFMSDFIHCDIRTSFKDFVCWLCFSEHCGCAVAAVTYPLPIIEPCLHLGWWKVCGIYVNVE